MNAQFPSDVGNAARDAPNDGSSAPARRMRSPYLLPLAMLAVLSIFLGIGLTLDPRLVPSPLVGKPVPSFRLAPVQGRTLGLASEDLHGEVAVIDERLLPLVRRLQAE